MKLLILCANAQDEFLAARDNVTAASVRAASPVHRMITFADGTTVEYVTAKTPSHLESLRGLRYDMVMESTPLDFHIRRMSDNRRSVLRETLARTVMELLR